LRDLQTSRITLAEPETMPSVTSSERLLMGLWSAATACSQPVKYCTCRRLRVRRNQTAARRLDDGVCSARL